MKRYVIWAIALGSLFLMTPNRGFAQTKPTPEIAKSFLDFYYQGQGKGVVLADIKVCADVIDAACTEVIDHSLLLAGMKYKIWMAFVVPEGDTVETLSLQFATNGETQFTRELSVKGSIRYRTWRTFNPTAPGIWEVKVMDNREIALEELAKLSLVVSQ